MKRICITGGAGFIGSHLCDTFVDDGHKVVVLDNEITGRTENIEHLAAHEHFVYYEHDVSRSIDIVGNLDWVLHLASLASPVFFQNNPIETLEVGAKGTHNTLKLARDKGAKYLFASSSEIYGDPSVSPQSEDYRGNVDPYGSRACYDESKRYGEALVRAYRDEHDLDVRVARIFNTYGPRMRVDDGRVIPNFLAQALTGEDLTVYGDGTQTRSFCYVSDLVDGLHRLMQSEVQTPVNLGSPDERTILDLANIVIERTGNESGITHESRPPQDPEVRRPDISKAKAEMDWEPTVELEEGLDRTIEYFTRAI